MSLTAFLFGRPLANREAEGRKIGVLEGVPAMGLALPGRRLVYTAGVLFLAAGAGGMLTAFGGITDRLIPLFAVGAFLSFTLSQAGMAAHWLCEKRGHVDRVRLFMNGFGAVATGAALVIILLAKFVEGAWLTLFIIPLFLGLLKLTRRYYRDLERQVLAGSHQSLKLAEHAPPSVLVPVERWDRLSRRALEVAARLSPDVVALHLTDLDGPDADEHEGRLRREWQRFVERPAALAGLPAPQLAIESSPYRSMLAPLLRHVEEQRERCPGRPVIVVLSELAGGRWWEAVLHTHRTKRLRTRVLRHGGPDVSVLIVPWQLEAPQTEQAIAEEEPVPAR